MRALSPKILWLLFYLLCLPALAQEPSRTPVNSSGEDPTRPVRRFDFRVNFQAKPENKYTSLTTLRLDTVQPFGDDDEWTLHTRFDLPSGWTDQSGRGQFGLSDTLVQNYVVAPSDSDVSFLVGARLEVPTATTTDLGKGKWTLAPAAGVVFRVPGISEGTFFGLVVWNQFDFAGDGGRSHINRLTLKPVAHFELGDGWYVQSQPEITHNHLNGDWFVPLDLMVGKMITPDFIVSVEYERSLGGPNPTFLQYVEVRTGFFF